MLKEISGSEYIGAGADESTDVSDHENMVVYVWFVVDGETKCKYLKMTRLHGTKAVDIKEAFCKILTDAKLLHKLVCFGSDGAAVMLGKDHGVATQLREDPRVWSVLVVFHCICHKVALAGNEAADLVTYYGVVDKFARSVFFRSFFFVRSVPRPSLSQIYNLMAHSAKRKEEFLEFQLQNKDGDKEGMLCAVKRANDTRWTGNATAYKSVVVPMSSVLDLIESLRDMTPESRRAALGKIEEAEDEDEESGVLGRLAFADVEKLSGDFTVLAALHYLADIVGDIATMRGSRARKARVPRVTRTSAGASSSRS